MATKKVSEEKINSEVIIGEIDEEKNTTDPKDKVIAELQKQMMEMQRIILNMQSGMQVNPQSDIDDVIFEIGTRFVNGVTIYSPRKEVEKDLLFSKTIEVDKYELDMLLKSNFVRDWFEKDILFFTDKNLYSKRKINKQHDLSDEGLIELFLNKSNTTEKVMKELSIMTKNFKDDPMIHCLFYRIVELCYKGVLNTMPFETRTTIEKAFNFKIENAQYLFNGFSEVK